MTELLLVPRPRELVLRGPGAPLDVAVTEQRDDALQPEGYSLTIDPDGVQIRHADDAGLRYARGLLDQIRSQSTDALPGLVARDRPDFPVRGYMLDVSRDRVPTRETLERIVGILALARINQLQLYTEHTFAFRDHEVVWRDASPITPDDIRWLDALCASNGIELVGNQNCFGHMNRWLAHDAYRHRAECPDGAKAPWGADLPPWTLAPTPDNAAFVLELFDELLPNFTSKRVNIGCDEPFDLGQGASADVIAQRGKTEVYLEHVDRIARPLTEQGYEVQIWGDVLNEDAALAAKLLPDGAVAVPWHYEQPWPDDLRARVPQQARDTLAALATDPMGGFRTQVEPLVGLDMPFWVAPGTAAWNSLVGRVDNAFGNLLDTASVGAQYGAGGYLITDWGDNGHHQPPSVSFGPMLYGGAVAWSHDANRDLDVTAALDTFVFDDDERLLGSSLDRLGRLWKATGQLAFNGSPIFRALIPRSTMSFGEIDTDACVLAVHEIDAAVADIAGSSPGCDDGAVVKRELTTAARLARHGVWRMARKAGGDVPGTDALRDDLREGIAMHRASWAERSRPGGLRESAERLERTLAEYD